MSHLLEAEVSDVAQCVLQGVSPKRLSQLVLLSSNDVDVMRDVVGGVVSCLSLALTLEPRLHVVGRTASSCGFMVYRGATFNGVDRFNCL